MPGRVCGPLVRAGQRAVLAPVHVTTAAWARMRERRAAHRALLDERARLIAEAAADLREVHRELWSVWDERLARVKRQRNKEEQR